MKKPMMNCGTSSSSSSSTRCAAAALILFLGGCRNSSAETFFETKLEQTTSRCCLPTFECFQQQHGAFSSQSLVVMESKYGNKKHHDNKVRRMSWLLLVVQDSLSCIENIRGGADLSSPSSNSSSDEENDDTTNTNTARSNQSGSSGGGGGGNKKRSSNKNRKTKKGDNSSSNLKVNKKLSGADGDDDYTSSKTRKRKKNKSIPVSTGQKNDNDDNNNNQTRDDFSIDEIVEMKGKVNTNTKPNTRRNVASAPQQQQPNKFISKKLSEYDISLHSVACGIGMTPLRNMKSVASLNKGKATKSRRKGKHNISSKQHDEEEGGSIIIEENILLSNNNDLIATKDARSTILTNYIFQSNGGTYIFQTFTSILSCLTGICSCIFAFTSTNTNPTISTTTIIRNNASITACYILLKQCAIIGMIKYALGMIGMVTISSKQISQRGLYETRQVVETLILNSRTKKNNDDGGGSGAIARYLFYSSWLVLWSSLGVTTTTYDNSKNGGGGMLNPPWWISSSPTNNHVLLRGTTIICLVGPIVLREIINIIWIISDILYILSFYPKDINQMDWIASISKTILTISSTIVSQVVNPIVRFSYYYGSSSNKDDTKQQQQYSTWIEADTVQRQQILSQLVTKISFLFELYTGGLVGIDLFIDCLEFVGISPITLWTSVMGNYNTFTQPPGGGAMKSTPTTTTTTSRPSISKLLKSIMCARLYLNFLFSKSSSSTSSSSGHRSKIRA